jgi:hypothetical protein
MTGVPAFGAVVSRFSAACIVGGAALVLGASTEACSGRVSGAPAGDRAAIGGDGGASGFGASGDASTAATLLLSLSPQAPTLCAGQCVQLTPQISGGVTPYALRWSDGVVSAGAPREVCPAATTTYTAVVDDSTGTAGELPHPASQATADVTVTIAPGACAGGSARDGGPSQDGGPTVDNAPIPTTGLHSVCSVDWQTNGGGGASTIIRGTDTAVALDPAGNILAATSFSGPFGAAPGAPSSVGSTDLMVVKLDSQCHVVWTRQYGAPGANLYLSAVHADADGNVLLAGMLQTDNTPNPFYWVDLGAGRQLSSNLGSFVTKLDPTGKTVWVNMYVPPVGDGAGADIVEDLAVDPSGNSVFTIVGTFDYGPGSSVDAGATGFNVVKLDPKGNLVFAKPSEEVGAVAYDIESVDTAPDGTIWIEGSDPTTAIVWASHLRADGSILQKVSMPSPLPLTTTTGGAVRVGPTGDVVLAGASGTGPSGSEWNRWFEGLSPSAAVTWTLAPTDLPGTPSDPAQLVRVDSSGNAWTAGQVLGAVNFGAPVGTLSSPSTSEEMYVVIYGPDGKPRSGVALGGMSGPIVSDMALGSQRSVVLSGWDFAPSTDARFFFVSNLGF